MEIPQGVSMEEQFGGEKQHALMKKYMIIKMRQLGF